MSVPTGHDRYLGTSEVARLLGVSRQAVQKRIRAGTLPAVKIGRNYVVERDAVCQTEASSDSLLDEIVSLLVDEYRPLRIYLFGSVARGSATRDSDYDILLVMPDTASDDDLRARRAYERLWQTDAAVDVLLWRQGAFDSRMDVKSSLPATVAREGRLLYAA